MSETNAVQCEKDRYVVFVYFPKMMDNIKRFVFKSLREASREIGLSYYFLYNCYHKKHENQFTQFFQVFRVSIFGDIVEYKKPKLYTKRKAVKERNIIQNQDQECDTLDIEYNSDLEDYEFRSNFDCEGPGQETCE